MIGSLVDSRPVNFTNATSAFDPLAVASSSSTHYEPFDTERRRNDSETGSVYGGGWGDIHFTDASMSGHSALHADVILDISNEGLGGGIGGDGMTVASSSGGSAETQTAALTTCLEEIALHDEA